ncbi:biotin transporter BioY [Rothia sp. ZJ1223]|uniref:biotin transporter BioY n=1 Tax=Rothia sp. ZJ1223 TaxID=2811098 RepID=UPI001956E52F|nr:biotin transporter BioY [Rothia sp. ZJ1223]MBM7050585.1 biotin transporter BioY [Rothia sp. ZJ1223]
MSSTHTSARPTSAGTSIALVAVFAALIAACALLPAIPIGPVGVPITLQTLGVYIAMLVLGPRRGAAACTLYLIAGFIGLPVFARGGSGVGVLAGPSAGYLLSYPVAAAVAGLVGYMLIRKYRAHLAGFFGQFAATCIALLIITGMGIVGMMVNAHLTLGAAFSAAIIYIPGDLIKGVLAALVAVAVHRAFPQLAGK